jgi:cobalt/nickel transport system ATP-binding protein
LGRYMGDMGHGGPLIRLEDVHFSYPGGDPALQGVSFQLFEGDRVRFAGPNGSGKTTLFHVIMDLQRPVTGTIELFGKGRQREKDFVEVRQRIGLLFQDPDDQLYSPTVLDDVAFGPLNQGKSIRDAKEIARKTLALFGLGRMKGRVILRHSGGEKKLVSLATVLAMEPQILLLDEPTTGLDPATNERLIAILKVLDLTCVFISHEMDFVTRTARRVLGMVGGRIVSEQANIPHTHIHSHGLGSLAHNHSHEGSFIPKRSVSD